MIDDLARQLATPMPRRRALRIAGAAMAMAAFPALRPAVGAASVPCGALGCNGKCCSATDWVVPGLQGVCCDPDEVCCLGARREKDPEHTYGWCCPAGQTCGDELGDCRAVCKAPMFECGQECCNEGASCCPIGADEVPMCCPDEHECVRQIQPGQAALTPDSPNVCCPPDQLVTALTVNRMCCPEGSVTQPGGGLSTAGGFCCKSGNVCGQDCCDSTPSFPKRCVGGRKCEFTFLDIDETKVTASRDGAVRVPLTLRLPTSGTVSVVMAGSAGKASAGGVEGVATAAAKKPVVLGKAKLRGKVGRSTVRVRLSRSGRSLLRRRGKLAVTVMVTLTDGKESTSVATPVTLRRR